MSRPDDFAATQLKTSILDDDPPGGPPDLPPDEADDRPHRHHRARLRALWLSLRDLAVTAAPFLVLTVLLLGRFEAAPARSGTSDEPTPHVAKPTTAILALVALSLSALVLEGAGFDWSAIFMRDVFQTAPWVGAAAVATGAFTQAVTRYLADRHVERHSPMKVARLMLSLLGVGNVLVVTAVHPALALIGFGLMGVGTSVLFPLAMSAAAQRTDRPAAVNVAALAQIAFVSFLLAPPLLGFVAEHVGIRWSYGVCLPLVLLSLAVSGVLRQRPAAQPGAAATSAA